MATATQTIDQNVHGKQDIGAADSALAGRGVRLVATLIDGLMMSAISIPATIALVMIGTPAIIAGILGMAVGIAAFAMINMKILESHGQTFGKRAMGIRIVDMSGNRMPAKQILMKRYLLLWGLGAIPFIGGVLAIVNALLIFGAGRSCGHDLVAGTKVVETEQS